MKASGLEVPPGVVTVTSTAPAAVVPGETAVTEVSETTVILVAGVEPKATAEAPVKLVPVRVTIVPPASAPAVGVREERVGEVVLGPTATLRAEAFTVFEPVAARWKV